MHRRKTQKRSQSQQSRQPPNSSDDFYTAISGKWLKNTIVPPTETRITQAYFTQTAIDRELHTIIREQKGPMAAFVSAWQSSEGRIPDGISSLVQIMMSMTSPADISARIGWMNRYGLPAPIYVYVQGDPHDHKHCRIFIEEGTPEIGIPEYWLQPEYAGHRKAYATYVKRIAAAIGLPAALLGYKAEHEFASVFPPAVDQYKTKINKFTWSELTRQFRTIDWDAMLEAWGLTAAVYTKADYNVTSSSFLHHFQTRMGRWPLERWRGWFALIAAQFVAGSSPKGPLRSAWFDYKRRFLRGSEADETSAEILYGAVKVHMPNTLGKLWVTRYCDPKVQRDVSVMVERIRDAAASSLRHTSWMAEATRTAAIRKLRAMEIQVAWPHLDKWKPKEVTCGLSDTDLIGNLMALSKLSTDVNQEQLAKGDCRHPSGDAWGKSVFDVNAYYYPDENRFLLPAAILRPPFYDPTKSAMWNYGSIGATIGHEICHGFDSEGREFDERGNKRSWWRKADDREYRKRAKAVVSLYESRQYRGMNVDGELTLVENIADVGGLEFALAGLRSAVGRALTKEELREFFTSFAVSWRSKDRLKRAAELLVTDPHSPPMLRVNHVVRQFDEWYEAFDVGSDAEGWIAPAKRIHFFR